MAGSPYVPTAKKYDPKDFQRVEGEPADPDPSTWGMQPDGTLPAAGADPQRAAGRVRRLPRPAARPRHRTPTSSTRARRRSTRTSSTPATAGRRSTSTDGVRYMLHYGGGNRWNVYDITDPRDLKVVDEETLPWTGPGFGAVTIQDAPHLGKRIAIQASETPRYFLKGRVANKWTDPTVEGQLLEWQGLRGFRTFEVNGPTPRDWTQLAATSTDPNHGPDEIQEGNGVLDLPVYHGGKVPVRGHRAGQHVHQPALPDHALDRRPRGVRRVRPRPPEAPLHVVGARLAHGRGGRPPSTTAPTRAGTTRPAGSARAWACSCRARSSRAGSGAMPRRAARGSSCWTCRTPRTSTTSAGARCP